MPIRHGRCCLTALCLLPLPVCATVTLHNPQWSIRLDPATLSISVTPTDQTAIIVSQGGPAHPVSALSQQENTVDWQWDGGQYRWQAVLSQADFKLTLYAGRTGTVTLLRQPGSAIGQGLMLPLAEGRYIPTADPLWQGYLADGSAEGLDTAQDLGLPLWGLDHGAYTLHWLLPNPFANRLRFTTDGHSLTTTLTHEFSAPNLAEPVTLWLHLGGADLLAGARRYRAWLIDSGHYQTLADKIRQVPETRKLIGASHLYLWGNGLLDRRNIRDWPGLIARLRSQQPLAVALRQQFDAEARSAMLTRARQPDRNQQKVLLAAINQALNQLARRQWQGAQPGWGSMANPYHGLRQSVLATFGHALTDPDQWGGGLSLPLVNALHNAGLPRLWLGMDNWEGGLWQRAALQAGVRAGYLIASYDSYQTALKPGEQLDWITAQQGLSVYQHCGVTLPDGKKKKGFKQSGFYTNPVCVRPVLRARTRALMASAGFNSWFLDAWGAGMTFDDITPGQALSQQAMARENQRNMQWVTDTYRVPVGSENGNAATSQGIAFAHGMQVPVIGWTDADLMHNKQSPFYLGGWYPAEQPDLFFKQRALKAPYDQLFFAAPYRLPLYQAVFHGSVITSNHWMYDNLKFSNVFAANLLAQWLYNVPPLMHLSADTLAARLPVLKCMDAAFRPLHQQLATQALTGFAWHDAEHRVQETRFADGSRLIANFGDRVVTIDQQPLPAHSLLAELAGQPARVLSANACR